MEFKIFEKFLENDNKELSHFLIKKYNEMSSKEIETRYPGKDTDFDDMETDVLIGDYVATGSVSTMKWKEYNVFQYYEENIYNIFIGLKFLVKEACDFYNINFENQKYMVQGWFNINSVGNGKLDWHRHNPKNIDVDFNFHGYCGVNIEPSITMYKDDENNIYENINQNNKMILSNSNFYHSMQDWDWNGARISLAYDVSPLKWVQKNAWDKGQHWIPLGY